MPTDGADFKRRVKYHGRTYTEIKDGSDVATVASFSAAGLAREISGDNPLIGFRDMVLAAEDCLQSIFGLDRSCLLQDLQAKLNGVASKHGLTESTKIARESLVREAGRITGLATPHESEKIHNLLLSACGSDLHEALVMDQARDYTKHHRHLSDAELYDYSASWKSAAADRLTSLMQSVFENGKPEKHFKSPRPDMLPIRSDSALDLNKSLAP